MLVVLLDASSSMEYQRDDVITATNDVLSKYTGIKLKLCTFNETVKVVFDGCIDEFDGLCGNDYVPQNMTSLYDAIGTALAFAEDGSTIIIATDGDDTASHTETRQSIDAKLANARSERDIKIIYIAEGTSAQRAGTDIGLTNSAPVGHDTISAALASQEMHSMIDGLLALEQTQKRQKTDE